MKLGDNPDFKRVGDLLLKIAKAWNDSPYLAIPPTPRAFMAGQNDEGTYQLIIFRGTIEDSMAIRKFLHERDKD